jgi:hypothetical protein
MERMLRVMPIANANGGVRYARISLLPELITARIISETCRRLAASICALCTGRSSSIILS